MTMPIVIDEYRTVEKDDGTLGAVIKCPKCKKYLGILNHNIDDKGIVEPSVVDDKNEIYNYGDVKCFCGFHDYIALKNWPNGIKFEVKP